MHVLLLAVVVCPPRLIGTSLRTRTCCLPSTPPLRCLASRLLGCTVVRVALRAAVSAEVQRVSAAGEVERLDVRDGAAGAGLVLGRCRQDVASAHTRRHETLPCSRTCQALRRRRSSAWHVQDLKDDS